MIRSPRTRRAVSLLLLVAGGLFLFLAPENIWVGVVLLGLGVALEVAGTLMQRQSEK